MLLQFRLNAVNAGAGPMGFDALAYATQSRIGVCLSGSEDPMACVGRKRSSWEFLACAAAPPLISNTWFQVRCHEQRHAFFCHHRRRRAPGAAPHWPAQGHSGVAVAWLRGAKESPCSLIEWMNAAEASLLRVTLPMAFDPTLTGARIYITAQNSGALRRYAEVPINQIEIAIPHVDQQTGLEPPFPLMQPMPAGRYVQHWKGRLLVAGIRTLNFSQPLAHHIHNARTDFVHFPQRITFVVGVDGGVWVGQQDHVVFLAGSEPDQWVSQRKAAQRPVPDSAVLLDSDVAGEVAGQTGCALWLAANGYVIGAPDGTLIERHRRKLAGIHGERGTTAVIDGRLVTAVM